MPFYDYKCGSCGHEFEVQQTMADESRYRECEKCKQIAKRQIAKGTVPIFKGSGFYQTDYKGKS